MRKYTFFLAAIVGAVLLWTTLAWAVDPQSNLVSGARLYANNCQTCHGVGAVGVSGVGPALKGEVANWRFDLFKRAVMRGIDEKGKLLKTAMPRWSIHGLKSSVSTVPTDGQLIELQAYLKSLK